MKYCSNCGNPVVVRIPEGDTRERFVCGACDIVHYQNPRIITGCMPVYEDRILLCRRAIHPRKGFWTLPAGFLENGETTQEGALRETLEEACARVEVDELYALYNLPHISQIYFFYRARLLDLDFAAGDESLEVKLFREQEVPWDELAFPVIRYTLEHYYSERSGGNFTLHTRNVIIDRAHKTQRE